MVQRRNYYKGPASKDDDAKKKQGATAAWTKAARMIAPEGTAERDKEITDLQAITQCLDCNEFGHWKGDP
eukprot:9232494-Prorocentrum_lima.AAC.1